jgi:hypothetical protein
MVRRLLLAALLTSFLIPLAAAPSHAVQPGFSINDVTVAEPYELGEFVTATFTVTLDRASDETVSVDFRADPAGGGDFQLATGTLTYAAGETAKSFGVKVFRDGVYEPSESFPVMLSRPVSAAVNDGQGTLTIRNVDPDGYWGCQAGVVYTDTAADDRGGVLIANPGPTGAPCAADREAAGPVSGYVPLQDLGLGQPSYYVTGYDAQTRVFSQPAGTPLSVNGTADLTTGAITYYDPYSRDFAIVQGLTSRARFSCAGGQPSLSGASTVAYGQAGNTYDGSVAASVNQQVEVLPSGAVVWLNRRVTETFTTPDGRAGVVLRWQPVVIARPDNSQVVFGESSVGYVGNPCLT